MNRQAVQTLKTYFGYDTFREGQESVVESILEHRMCLQSCRQEQENPSVIRYRH